MYNYIGRAQTLTQIPSIADTLCVAHWKFGLATQTGVGGTQHNYAPTAERHQDQKFRGATDDLITSYSPSSRDPL